MLNSLWIAFRTYSRIPVPEAEWTEDNMKYAMCFSPLVGVVIGGAEFLWMFLAGLLHCPFILQAAIASLLPLLITGAIHMDGFMDTTDALASHQDREKMLQILKDSHTGAFAVISALMWMLAYFAAFTGIATYKSLWIIGFGFIMSRSLSALAVVLFRSARENGMLHAFSGTAQGYRVMVSMAGYFAVSALCMIVLGGWRGLIAVLVNCGIFLYYRLLSYRKFGGITGDLAGWFLQLAELGTALSTALFVNVLP